MPSVYPGVKTTYQVGDRVECIVKNNYLRVYHDIIPGVRGTVAGHPDGVGVGGEATGMLILWDSDGSHVRCGFKEVKKVEEGVTMTEQTEFKVGDKVKWRGHESYGTGEVLGFRISPSGYRLAHLRLDKFNGYDDRSEYREDKYDGLDYHEIGTSALELIPTLAEKRAEDFKILDEASEKWRSPEHYKFPGGVQVIDITRHLSFPLGNVVKYVSRAGKKGPKLEDLEKAKKYLEWAIEDAKKEGN